MIKAILLAAVVPFMTQHRDVVPKTEVSTNFYGSVTGIVDRAYIEAHGGGGSVDTNAIAAVANEAVRTNATIAAHGEAIEANARNIATNTSDIAENRRAIEGCLKDFGNAHELTFVSATEGPTDPTTVIDNTHVWTGNAVKGVDISGSNMLVVNSPGPAKVVYYPTEEGTLAVVSQIDAATNGFLKAETDPNVGLTNRTLTVHGESVTIPEGTDGETVQKIINDSFVGGTNVVNELTAHVHADTNNHPIATVGGVAAAVSSSVVALGGTTNMPPVGLDWWRAIVDATPEMRIGTYVIPNGTAFGHRSSDTLAIYDEHVTDYSWKGGDFARYSLNANGAETTLTYLGGSTGFINSIGGCYSWDGMTSYVHDLYGCGQYTVNEPFGDVLSDRKSLIAFFGYAGAISRDGLHFLGLSGSDILFYDLSVPNDLTTGRLVGTLHTKTFPGMSDYTCHSFAVSPDGEKLILVNQTANLALISLSTAWNSATATLVGIKTFGTNSWTSVAFDDRGLLMLGTTDATSASIHVFYTDPKPIESSYQTTTNGVAITARLIDLPIAGRVVVGITGGIDTNAVRDIAREIVAPVSDSVDEEVVRATDAERSLSDRIDVIERTSHPNMTIVGRPNIYQGSVSGFSANDYLVFPTEVDVGTNAVDFIFSFHTGEDVTTQQNVLDSLCGLAFAIRDGGTITAISYNGLSFVQSVSQGTIDELSSYKIKLEFRYAQNYTVTTFIDDCAGGWTQIGQVISMPSPIFKTATYWGGANPKNGIHHILRGSISLDECRMEWNGRVVWRGYDEIPTVRYNPSAEIVLDTADRIVESSVATVLANVVDPNNESFSNAVVSVALPIGTNELEVLREIGGLPIGEGASGIGALLAALATAVVWLKRKTKDVESAASAADTKAQYAGQLASQTNYDLLQHSGNDVAHLQNDERERWDAATIKVSDIDGRVSTLEEAVIGANAMIDAALGKEAE